MMVSMSDALEEIAHQAPSDPDAQATVTDFLDFTEYLPSDLIRSLTLIRKLDESYQQRATTVHELTRDYGRLPNLPDADRPDPRQLRTDIARNLTRAINARESAYAEASRLYDVMDRHCNRLAMISTKLRSLPLPPSRDPSPVPVATVSPQTNRRNVRKAATEVPPTPRITLRIDNRPSTGSRASAISRRQKAHGRRATIPGEVLPPRVAESPVLSSEESEWESLPPSPAPRPTSRAAAAAHVPKEKAIRIKPPKPPRIQKIKLVKKASRGRRPAGPTGTRIPSDDDEETSSNELALLSAPPKDAAPGSVDAPWLRLTAYEMAKLRKRMKKNSVWCPSETMIRRELADLGRGPEIYNLAKKKAQETGLPLLDAANIEEQIRNPVKRILAEGELGVDSLDVEEIQLSNRGMKLNEAKKLKKENLQKEMAAQAAAEAELAAQRLADSGSALKAIFARSGDSRRTERALISPTTARVDAKNARKRKRDGSAENEPTTGDASAASVRGKKQKQDTATTIKIPLAPPGPSTSAPPVSTATVRQRAPPVTKTEASPEAPSSSRPVSRRGTTPVPATAGKDRPRRNSTISLKLSEPAAPSSTTIVTTAAGRRGKRPAPGPVKEGTAVSVGKRKAAPKQRGKSTASRKPQIEEQQLEEEEDGMDEDDLPIDPDEPTYCLCGDVSYGEMIACENKDCELEWFHLGCVGLTETPGRTTKWYCPDCRKAMGIGDDGFAKPGGRKR